MNENKKTVLVAVNSDTKEARLLPYTLADIEELVELAHCLEYEDIPEDLKKEFADVLVPLVLSPTAEE